MKASFPFAGGFSDCGGNCGPSHAARCYPHTPNWWRHADQSHHKGLGSTRFLSGTNGAVTDTYVYNAFGTTIANTGSTTNLYLFAGEQFDPHLNLYLNRARYSNANTGRFWTMDSNEGFTAEPLSLHKYVYAADNPVNLLDPSGQDPDLATTTASGGVASYISTITAQVVTRAASAQRLLRAAFKAKDFSEVGSLWNEYGSIAEDAAENVIQLLCRGSRFAVERAPKVATRFLDFSIKSGSKLLRIEVKFNLPQKGAALTGLEALAANFSRVVFQSGINGVFEYLTALFGL